MSSAPRPEPPDVFNPRPEAPDVFNPHREPPDVEMPRGARDFDRLYASWPDEAEAIGWYEARVEMERDPERPPPIPEAHARSGLELALLTFRGVNSAVKAFAVARERSRPGASWPRQVAFVERHGDGRLVLTGKFAGHSVAGHEALHVSDRGAVSEPQPLSDRLRTAVPLAGSAIVLIADPHDIDDLVTATRGTGAHLVRRTLTKLAATALESSLSATPGVRRAVASGENAAEATDTATRDDGDR